MTAPDIWRSAQFLAELKAKDYKNYTLEKYGDAIERFVTWAKDMGIHDPEDVSLNVLESYRQHVHRARIEKGRKNANRPLAGASKVSRLGPVRLYFRWLYTRGYITLNPAADFGLPRVPKRLPLVLTLDEVKRILAQPDTGTALGLRDRAMLEVFYATAIRREELARLTYSDLNLEHGTAVIRQGKGDKDRVVPVTERAMMWIERYTSASRPKLTQQNDSGYLFVTKNGEYLDGKQSYKIVRAYFDKAGVQKPGGPHLLRHACATHMLEGGADVRYVQELLGHANLETTQIYTHVSIGKLKNVHQKAHPLADVETD